MTQKFSIYFFLSIIYCSFLLSITSGIDTKQNDEKKESLLTPKVLIAPYKPQEQNPDFLHLISSQSIETKKNTPLYYDKKRGLYYFKSDNTTYSDLSIQNSSSSDFIILSESFNNFIRLNFETSMERLPYSTVLIESNKIGTGFFYIFCGEEEKGYKFDFMNRKAILKDGSVLDLYPDDLVSTSQRTAFYKSREVFLITSGHIIEVNGECQPPVIINLHFFSSDDQLVKEIRVEYPRENVIYSKEGIDLCAMNMSDLIKKMDKVNLKLIYFAFNKETFKNMSKVKMYDEIAMLTYPGTICDSNDKLPIIRKGVIASAFPNRNFKGKPEFLIDCPFFYGSSGSPILSIRSKLELDLETDDIEYVSRIDDKYDPDYEPEYDTQTVVTGGSISKSKKRVSLLGVLRGGPFEVVGKDDSDHIILKIVESADAEVVEDAGVLKNYFPINIGYVIKCDQIENLIKSHYNAEADENQGNIFRTFDQYYELAGRHDPAAQMKLRSIYKAKQGIFENLQKALEYYEQKVNAGEVTANIIVGWIYRDGFLDKEGREIKDAKKAFANFEIAAKQGFAIAQDNLGWMYLNGQGITQDYDKALEWYARSANQGYALAQFNLGVMYTEEGVNKNYTQAIKWFTKAAKQGFADAQTNLGSMYQNGQGVEKNDAEAIKWYTQAANQGEANAQYNLGWMYQNGRGVVRSDAEAVYWFTKAAEQGFADAQNNLGIMYANGYGVPSSNAKAVYWFTKAANQGYVGAKLNLSLVCLNKKSVSQSDVDEAIEQFFKAANQGCTAAQCNLGMMYLNGQGVEKNDVEAVNWLAKAAEQGFAPAQNNLGYMYQSGRGVNQDYAKAIEWFTKAANQDSEMAQNNLGAMYLNGQGVEKNDVEAFKWYAKAANQGFAPAQFILGWAYKNGEGVLKSDVEAIKWFAKAAEQGYALAQFNLGWMCAKGQGMKQDYDEAFKWWRKAAEQVDTMRQSNLEVDEKKQSDRKEGVPQSDPEAISRKAIEKDNTTAQPNLWEMPSKEQGISQNDVEADERYTKQQFFSNFPRFLSFVCVH